MSWRPTVAPLLLWHAHQNDQCKQQRQFHLFNRIIVTDDWNWLKIKLGNKYLLKGELERQDLEPLSDAEENWPLWATVTLLFIYLVWTERPTCRRRSNKLVVILSHDQKESVWNNDPHPFVCLRHPKTRFNLSNSPVGSRKKKRENLQPHNGVCEAPERTSNKTIVGSYRFVSTKRVTNLTNLGICFTVFLFKKS